MNLGDTVQSVTQELGAGIVDSRGTTNQVKVS